MSAQKDDKNPLRIHRPDTTAEALRSDPQLLADRAKNERTVARGIPVLAFVDHPLPDGAVAVLLLGQTHKGPSRYIVVSRKSFTDDVLHRVMDLSMQWQRDNPTDESPTTIALFSDGRYEGHAGAGQISGTQTFKRFGPAREVMSPELLAQADAATPVTIPKFGAVRLVPLK